MIGYPTIWVRGWLLCATAGVCLAMLVWAPMVTLWVTVTAVVGAAAGLAWAQRRSPDQPVLGDYGCSRRELAAAIGLGLVGLRAVGDVSPALVFWTVLALAASHPKLVQAVAQALRRLAPESSVPQGVTTAVLPGAGAAAAGSPSPASLTTPELCEAWRASFRLLTSARTSLELQRAVALRQAYLDEMGRRDSAGLSAWLESGARPSGAPERYLRGWTVSEGE